MLTGRHSELCSWLAIQSNWLQPQERGRIVVGFTTSRQVSSKSTPLFAAAYCLLSPTEVRYLLCCSYSSFNLYTSQGFSKSSTAKVGEERVISGWTQYLIDYFATYFPFSKSAYYSSIKEKNRKKSHKESRHINK